MINKEFIIRELSNFSEYDLSEIKNLSEESLTLFFNKHCEKYSEEVEILKIWEEFGNVSFLAYTPDGYQMVGDLYKKLPKDIFEIKTGNKKSIKCSSGHMLESSKGWIETSEIKEGDLILTDDGYSEVIKKENLGKDYVYDWEILHKNHRYWAGGISSHNTGKSFLCMNIVREAQKKDYNVIYCDTEGAIDKSGAKKFGIDTNKVRYQPIKTISDFKVFVANLVDKVKTYRKEGADPKIALILDSLGMLSTDKETGDALKGKSAMDMGIRSKELRSLFRVITLDLTAVKIPLICTNHTTTGNIGGFMPTKEAAGGDGPIFSMSNVIMLSKAQLKEGSDNTRTGIVVTSTPKKARFTRPYAVKFHISFMNGMNPYVGLQDFVSWDICGIERGKLEVDKKTGEMEFTPNASSTRWAIKHLGKTVTSSQLFTSEIFTDEVLHMIDEKAIKPHFLLPDLFDDSELEELANPDADENTEDTKEAVEEIQENGEE